MPIDVDEAIVYLGSHLEWDAEPALTQEQQLRLLEYSKAVDVNNVSPGGTGYVETYTFPSLWVAIHEGWVMKEAAATPTHLNDGEYRIYDHCKEKRIYWGNIVAGLSIGGTPSASASGSFAIPNIQVW